LGGGQRPVVFFFVFWGRGERGGGGGPASASAGPPPFLGGGGGGQHPARPKKCSFTGFFFETGGFFFAGLTMGNVFTRGFFFSTPPPTLGPGGGPTIPQQVGPPPGRPRFPPGGLSGGGGGKTPPQAGGAGPPGRTAIFQVSFLRHKGEWGKHTLLAGPAKNPGGKNRRGVYNFGGEGKRRGGGGGTLPRDWASPFLVFSGGGGTLNPGPFPFPGGGEFSWEKKKSHRPRLSGKKNHWGSTKKKTSGGPDFFFSGGDHGRSPATTVLFRAKNPAWERGAEKKNKKKKTKGRPPEPPAFFFLLFFFKGRGRCARPGGGFRWGGKDFRRHRAPRGLEKFKKKKKRGSGQNPVGDFRRGGSPVVVCEGGRVFWASCFSQTPRGGRGAGGVSRAAQKNNRPAKKKKTRGTGAGNFRPRRSFRGRANFPFFPEGGAQPGFPGCWGKRPGLGGASVGEKGAGGGGGGHTLFGGGKPGLRGGGGPAGGVHFGPVLSGGGGGGTGDGPGENKHPRLVPQARGGGRSLNQTPRSLLPTGRRRGAKISGGANEKHGGADGKPGGNFGVPNRHGGKKKRGGEGAPSFGGPGGGGRGAEKGEKGAPQPPIFFLFRGGPRLTVPPGPAATRPQKGKKRGRGMGGKKKSRRGAVARWRPGGAGMGPGNLGFTAGGGGGGTRGRPKF